MNRLDLPKGYGGWQVIDATPQERSEGEGGLGRTGEEGGGRVCVLVCVWKYIYVSVSVCLLVCVCVSKFISVCVCLSCVDISLFTCIFLLLLPVCASVSVSL